MSRRSLLLLSFSGFLLTLVPALGQPPESPSVTIHPGKEQSYFRVLLDPPADLVRSAVREPRLLPQGGTLRNILRVPNPNRLEFIGQYASGTEAAPARLIYPTNGEKWASLDVKVILKNASVVGNLEKSWAQAQVREFAQMAAHAGDFEFFAIAAHALARKYGLPAPQINVAQAPNAELPAARLYELTTGATAVTESLQLRRMSAPRTPQEERTIPVAGIPGITIAEHPWEKMMAGQKPAEEPLARMIPHDNYYIRFLDPGKMLEFVGLLETWGGNLTRSYEFTSRDYRLWQRYETQLGIDAAALAKEKIGLRGLAITGNDAFVRDGTDITVLFDTTGPKDLLALVDRTLAARPQPPGKVQSSDSEHLGVRIVSVVSPLREVSHHRATLGDVVVVSNSLVALQRVITTAIDKGKRLADSLDFQYMRTVFRADEKSEDGFFYLPDAFIRNFVSPSMRIKQKRRLEALVSLNMMTNAALLTAWETGKLPASTAELFQHSGLKAKEIALADDRLEWNATASVAVGTLYGSIHFATPLLELPINLVTPSEDTAYRQFHREYLQLWRRFFDPIGMRLSLRSSEVKLETYILPLIESQFYSDLRRFAGNGPALLDLSTISPRTLIQVTSHINPEQVRSSQLGFFAKVIGSQALLRLDDGPEIAQFLGWGLGDIQSPPKEWPLALGIELTNHKQAEQIFNDLLPLMRTFSVDRSFTAGESTQHAGVNIRSFAWSIRDLADQPGKVTCFVAFFSNCFYASLSRNHLCRIIDEVQERKDRVGRRVAINSSLHLAPQAAQAIRPNLERLLNAPTRQQARAALTVWHSLYRAGLISADANPDEAAQRAYRLLGFVPTAPDRTATRYDAAASEMVNERHGSLREPNASPGLAPGSPLYRVLENLATARADLRFREDGIHTTLTLDRSWSPDALKRLDVRARADLITRLTEGLNGPDRYVRARSAANLGKLAPEAKESIPLLQASLFDPAPEVRTAAETALKAIDPQALAEAKIDEPRKKLLLPRLFDLLQAADRWERESARELLEKLGRDGEVSLREGLLAASSSSDLQVRFWALGTLVKVNPAESPRVVELLAAELWSTQSEARFAAAALLQRISPEDFWKNLVTNMKDRDPRIQMVALDLFARQGEKARPFLADLEELAYRSEFTVRQAAVAAVRNIDSVAGKRLMDELMLLDLKSTDQAVRLWAVNSLERAEDRRLAIPLLSNCLSDSNRNVRVAAAHALRAIAPRENTFRRLLVEIQDPDRVRRLVAVQDLAEMGTAARAAEPELSRIREDDPSFDVRIAAAEALRRIKGR